MRSVIATEVIPNIMHARRGGRVLSAQAFSFCVHMSTSPTQIGDSRFRASVKSTSAHLRDFPCHFGREH